MNCKRILIPSALCGIAVVLGGCASSAPTHNTTNINVVNNNSTTIVNASGKKQISGAKFDIDAVIKAMDSEELKFGSSSDAGVWVVTRVEILAEDEVPADELLIRAGLTAKKNISEWLSNDVSSSTSIKSEMTNVNGNTEVNEDFKSEVQSKSAAFLRGITCYRKVRKDGNFTAWYYSTTKAADRSAEFEAQLKAAPPGVVRATGFGTITGGKLKFAKREAKQAALQAAVEQVMGTTVIGQSQLMDNSKAKSKLISQTAGNVKEYRIVKEGKEGSNYIMIINAKVDEKNLLDNYAAMVRSMGNPGFIVKCQDPDLKAAFSGFLSNLGFKVVTRDAEAAFVVDGNCKYLEANHEYYGKGIQIDLNLRLLDKKSGQEFFNISNEPRFTTSFSGTLHQIRQSSARKAFNKMREELHKKLNKVVMDWVLNGRQVDVVFNNFNGDTKLLEQMAKSLNMVPCAKCETFTLDGKKVTFKCSYVGPTADFNEFLFERFNKDFPEMRKSLKTGKIDINSLEIDFAI